MTEAVNFNGKVESIVTGIGINITTHNFEGNFNAGAIFDEGEKILFSREELCAKIADYIMDFAEDLNNPEIISEYRRRSILTGKNISYIKGDTKFFAEVLGINDDGGLIVLNQNSEKEILRSGEVSMIR